MRAPSPLRLPLIASLALHLAIFGMVAAWASNAPPDQSEEGFVLAELDLVVPSEPEGPPASPATDPVPEPILPILPEPSPIPPPPPMETIAEPIVEAPPLEPTPSPPTAVTRSHPPRPEKPARRTKPAAAPSSPSPSATGTAESASTPEPPRAMEGNDAAPSSEYLRKLRTRLERARAYPIEARDRGWSGTASVRFSIGRDGGVEKLELAAGSGRRLLDEAALETVRRAAPFPAFPPEIKRETLDLTLPVAFRLDDE